MEWDIPITVHMELEVDGRARGYSDPARTNCANEDARPAEFDDEREVVSINIEGRPVRCWADVLAIAQEWIDALVLDREDLQPDDGGRGEDDLMERQEREITQGDN